MATNDSTSGRGLASMDDDTKHDIQSSGGKASAEKQDTSKLGEKARRNKL